MTPPTNTCTVTFADAHSHTFAFAGVPAGGNTTMQMKLDALKNTCAREDITAAADFAAFTQTDTLTVTITQP
jgi:hypothetical protein